MAILDFLSLWKVTTLLHDPYKARGTFLASLATSHTVVLEIKSKTYLRKNTLLQDSEGNDWGFEKVEYKKNYDKLKDECHTLLDEKNSFEQNKTPANQEILGIYSRTNFI